MFMEPSGGAANELRPPSPPKRRSIAFVELITTAALALSTAVAVTAVSIGIARAEALGGAGNADSAPFAIALFIASLLFVGSVAAVAPGDSQPD